ncbi:MAG: cupin domain-containing protein [Alphaproteobacteria bacterium]|nr:cupin domain-containing protein [Alphaproteobacteria bacterium]
MTTRMMALRFLLGAGVLAVVPVTSGKATEPPGRFEVVAVAERKLTRLPAGPLYWRVESLPTLADAQARAAAHPTALAAEVAGRAWLVTLDAKGGTTPGATRHAEIGPVPMIRAEEYLLRLNRAGGPAGARTPTHTHPGSEAFYVISGRLGQKTPAGTAYAEAGQALNGHDGDTPMEVFSAGPAELAQLVMFVVDAGRPFSSPAKLPH